jgi:hypothetical protein
MRANLRWIKSRLVASGADDGILFLVCAASNGGNPLLYILVSSE